MREYKCRVFSNVEQRMIGWDDIRKEPNLIEYLEHPNRMDYTSLKDKNGKEIYEGDILSDKYNNKQIVKWGTIHDGEMGDSIAIGYDLDPEYCGLAIIGNIYENPELLEETK